MGEPAARSQRPPLAAGRRTATFAAQPCILLVEQPDSQSDPQKRMAEAGLPPRSGGAHSMADRQEPLLVSVGIVDFTCGGEGGDATVSVVRATVELRREDLVRS